MRFPVLLALSAAALYAQTAVFPGAIATDTQLRVAVNQFNPPTLTLPILNTTDTSATVSNATGIVASSIVTIDNEHMAVCNVVGNVLSFGKASCPNVDGRNFDGTTAATHAAQATVNLNIDAWHHNAMKEEVKAIETALGVNLANVGIPNPLTVNKGGTGVQTLTGVGVGSGTGAFTGVPAASELQYLRRKPNNGSTVSYEFTAAPLVSPVDYNFPAQTPGGSLTAAVGATVTVTPCPLGVAGAATHLMEYLSAGTGTAEAVTITGGTCTSGASTGTIIFTPANNHTGAWTISSATAGAQEACLAVTPCNLNIPAGTYNWYGTFWSAGNVSIMGGGANVTTINWNQTASKMIDVERDYFVLRGVTLNQVGVATAGSIGVYFAGAGSGGYVNTAGTAVSWVSGSTFQTYWAGATIKINGVLYTVANVASGISLTLTSTAGVQANVAYSAAFCDNALVRDVSIIGFYNAVYNQGDGGSIDLERVHVNNSTQDAVVGLGSQGYWRDLVIVNNTGNAIRLGPCGAGTGCGASPFQTNTQTYNNGGWGIYSLWPISVAGSGCFLNNDYLGEVFVNLSSGSSADNGSISDCYIQFAGLSVSWGTNTTAPGILTAAGSGPIAINNIHLLDTQGNGVEFRSPLNQLTNSHIIAAGQGAQAGNVYNILVNSATGGDEVISGNVITNAINRIDGVTNTITNNFISGSSASPVVYISSGTEVVFTGNQIQQAGAGTAYTLDGGVSLIAGSNMLTGTGTNNGVLAAKAVQLFSYSAKAYSSLATTLTLVDSTWTSIPFDSESFDSGSLHSTSAATSRFTLPVAGTWVLTGQGAFTPNASGTQRKVRWLLNGATLLCSADGILSGTVNSTPQATCTIQLAAGDYVELQAYQDRGGTLVLIGATASSTWASVARLF